MADPTPVMFDTQSAKRIDRAVTAVEQALPGGGGGRTGFAINSIVPVKISSPTDAPGKYNAKSYGPNARNINTTDPLAEEDLGKIATRDDVLFLFPPDIATQSNSLPDDLITLGKVVGFTKPTDSSTPQMIVVGIAAGSLPVGQYDGMLYQMLTDLQGGWNWLRASAMRSTGTPLETE